MGRPHVTFNCAVSLDGKIGPVDRSHIVFSSPEDRRRMGDRRAAADAIIIGGTTMRAAPHALIEDPDPSRPPRTKPMLNVVLSRTLDLPSDHPAFKDPRVKWLVFTDASAPKPRVQAMQSVAELVLLPDVNAPSVLAALEERGSARVLLEAGGTVAAQFFHAGCIDEVYLTLAPVLLGGRGAPSPADGESWPLGQWPHLTLVESQAVGDEVFLHYRRG